MNRLRVALITVGVGMLAGCGPVATSRTLSARQALTQNSEALELETTTVRQDLFHEMVRTSATEAGRPATELVLFPIERDGELVAAPGLEPRVDLLATATASMQPLLTFDTRSTEPWSDERKDSLQGLSEREAVELVARALLTHWSVASARPIRIDRAAGAPYAAAYVDGILRVNPAFLYIATSVNPVASASAP